MKFLSKITRRRFVKQLFKVGLFLAIPLNLRGTNIEQDCNITTSDIEGPFYIPNSPNISICVESFSVCNLLPNFIIFSK